MLTLYYIAYIHYIIESKCVSQEHLRYIIYIPGTQLPIKLKTILAHSIHYIPSLQTQYTQ